ncbi:MAG: glutamate---cysteine ligase / carboxylate-amine ligase, partial [Frankiaceae bacterium]|nr:glutamate---cysteine ligase / carboxylate-amine ligase [Frankiaceae bacterium]
GYTLPMPKGWTVRENKWRAARYGIEAEIILDETGRTAPLRDALDELVDDLTPIAERLGCTSELCRVKEILEIGPSYARQRAVAAANGGDLTAVVDALMAEMRNNAPIRAVAAT